MNGPGTAVSEGTLVALRLFDVAYSIDLARAEAHYRTRTGSGTSRRQLSAARTKAIAFDVPPLQLSLEPIDLQVGARRLKAAAAARLYDFGAVAISLEIVADGSSWSDYVDLANALDAAVKGAAGARLWQSILDPLRTDLSDALTKPSNIPIEEDYLLAFVRRWDQPMDRAALLSEINLEPLLSGETFPLSDEARKDLLRYRFSYSRDDLVVLTWDRAFLYEPRGDMEVADVLEVANAQLLEMRYYDTLLDDELPRMYHVVEETRRRWHLLGPRRLANLARSLYSVVAEVTEVTEKVDNALQVTEDVYLARVYAAALEQFRVRLIGAAVDRKLAIIKDTYTALHDEATSSRAGLMEAAIVLLIVIELLLALVHA